MNSADFSENIVHFGERKILVKNVVSGEKLQLCMKYKQYMVLSTKTKKETTNCIYFMQFLLFHSFSMISAIYICSFLK